MPLVVTLALNLILGALAALAAARELRASPRAAHRVRAFRALLIHEVAIAMPVAAYVLVRYADWSLSYALDGARLPSAVMLVLVVLHCGLALAGFALGARLLREHRGRAVVALCGGAVVAVAVLAVALRHRVAVVGTYVQYRSGFGVSPLAASSLLSVGGMLAAAWTLAAVHMLWALWKRF